MVWSAALRNRNEIAIKIFEYEWRKAIHLEHRFHIAELGIHK